MLLASQVQWTMNAEAAISESGVYGIRAVAADAHRAVDAMVGGGLTRLGCCASSVLHRRSWSVVLCWLY